MLMSKIVFTITERKILEYVKNHKSLKDVDNYLGFSYKRTKTQINVLKAKMNCNDLVSWVSQNYD